MFAGRTCNFVRNAVPHIVLKEMRNKITKSFVYFPKGVFGDRSVRNSVCTNIKVVLKTFIIAEHMQHAKKNRTTYSEKYM